VQGRAETEDPVRILVVEDSRPYLKEMQPVLARELAGEVIEYVSHLAAAVATLSGPGRRRLDLVILDVIFPLSADDERNGHADPRAGFKFLDELARVRRSVKVVVLSSQEKQTAVELLVRFREVADYLFKDTPWKEVVARLKRLVAEVREARRVARESAGLIVGEHPGIVQVKEMIRDVAPTEATVLIEGESGTGKELAARAIHDLSARWRGPFVPVNCATLGESLLESELFGHRKGAFTGALEDREGKFEAADGGTLFLDEAGEIPLALQPKLLRALQEREVERLGENRIRKVDVRIVAATNRDLKAAIKAGRFREDLYYRLAVFPLAIPPLRARPDDVARLVDHLVAHFNRRMGRRIQGVEPDAMARLAAHDWPGNVRELANLVERAFILCRADRIPLALVAPWLRAESGEFSVSYPPAATDYLETKRRVVEEFDRQFFTRFMRKHRGHLENTAREIGYNRKDLRKKLKELGMDKGEFKLALDAQADGGGGE
jgi:two-component system NtrC family response regulator